MLSIQRKISPYNHSGNNNVKYIVIHYTGNRGDTAKNNADYFYGGDRGASAHYFVDNNSIWQVVEEYNGAWHCGDGGGRYGITNRNSIGIEQCCMSNGEVSAQTEANCIELVKYLMKKYGLGVDRVVRHYDASRKICPNWSSNNWARWWNFKNKLGGNYTSNIQVSQSSPSYSAPQPAYQTKFSALVQIGQIHANNFACGAARIAEDGICGPATKKARVKVLQQALNLDYGAGLAIDGDFGIKSRAALGSHYVRRGEHQYMVTALEILLYLNNYDPKGLENPGSFGPRLEEAVVAYQKDHHLSCDGVAGKQTFLSLLA